MESPTPTEALERDPARAGRDATTLARRLKRRLNESKLRSNLRARPRAQGRVLAPAGMFRRLPTAAALFFPFYHDVLPEYGRDLRRHLSAYRDLGPLVSWDEALDVLAGRRLLTGPTFCLSFDDGHPTWRDVVAPILADMSVPATFFLTTDLIGRPGNLSWADCRELADAGHTLGSHTVTHPRLADCDPAELNRQVADSKAEIEDRVGLEVRDFAAPYGAPGVDVNQREVEAVRAAGYRSFATTARLPMHPGDSPMWIQRQGLHPAWPLWAVRTRLHD
jgi:peptidoglycan/xylan/chitin deacetylase (PgdA/CDA1 family)